MSDAVLQFEIDRKRWAGLKADGVFNVASVVGETPYDRLYAMAKTAVCDTIRNNGTFVLVATPDKITMVQRTTTEDF